MAGAHLESLTTGLNLVGAGRVDAKDFRTLDGSFDLERPLGNGHFTAWELPKIQGRAEEDCHEWRLGVRLGESTSGAWSRRIYQLP